MRKSAAAAEMLVLLKFLLLGGGLKNPILQKLEIFFLIVSGGDGTAVEGTAVDYNLDDVAFEMSQVSEGYIMRVGLDDLRCI